MVGSSSTTRMVRGALTGSSVGAARRRPGLPPARVSRPFPSRLRAMQLSDEQRAIQSLAREFAEGEIVPHAARWDREHHFPRELFRELGKLGLMGVCVAEELG